MPVKVYLPKPRRQMRRPQIIVSNETAIKAALLRGGDQIECLLFALDPRERQWRPGVNCILDKLRIRRQQFSCFPQVCSPLGTQNNVEPLFPEFELSQL